MSNYKCKCGCTDMFVKNNGNQNGLYCKSCGKCQKWLGKDELKSFEYNESHNKMCPINDLIKECNKDLLYSCDKCGFNDRGRDPEYSTLLCLLELIKTYNTKFNTKYILVDKQKIDEIKRMLDDCECV